MSKNYISPSMLPMKEISQYMDLVYGFGKKTDSSNDTKNVSGTSSELIAIAATNEKGALVVDRETVKNSLQLGGIDASKYVTTDGAEALLSDTYKVSTNTGNEIKNLRDELYQIKSELVKAGMLKNTECYNGFFDPFKAGKIKYISNIITLTSTELSGSQINSISVEDSSDLAVGEYIVINTSEPQIAKILDIVGQKIVLETSIVGPISSGVEIYKTYGEYHNGSFVFGENQQSYISSTEKYIILNDDAQPLVLTKKYTPNSGYAAQINIPSTAKGAIRKIGVQAKVTGFPGALKCYVIDVDSTMTDISTLTTIDELREDGKIIGESDLLHPSQATTSYNELYFNFSNTINLVKSNYMFLFVQIDADANNYWELKGLRGQTSLDLQTNSKLYSFADGVGLRLEDGDLYLIVVTSDILLNYFKHNKQGLYSCNVKLSSLTKATRVRVELKVNREGRFKIVDNPNTLVPSTQRPVNTFNEDNKSYPISLFNTGEQIVVGNFVSKVGNNRVNNTSFNLASEVYAPAGAPVYRVGYKVQAKAYNTVFDPSNLSAPMTAKDVLITELKLISVLPGKEAGKEEYSSDRLIFEGELKIDPENNYILKDFNELDVQVFWENKSATSIDLNNSPELAGKIFDIVVSTDNTYNTIK